MENKGKTRRLRKAILAAMLPFMAMGASSIAKGQSAHPQNDNEVVCEERLYAAGPSTLFAGYGAYHAHYYEQPTFVVDYFRNLTENFPTNNCGNCGYTAAAMLLCYYDTYWNANIINDRFNSDPAKISGPESYDCSSPGIKDFAAHIDDIDESKRPKDGAPEWEWDAYNAYLVDEVYGPYLAKMRGPDHLKDNLMSLLYDMALGNNKSQTVLWHFGIKEPDTSTNAIYITNLLNLYFSEVGLSDLVEAKTVSFSNFAFDNHTPISMQRRMLRASAVSRLRNGQPIIYGGDLKTDYGHYDKSQGYVLGNGHLAIAYGFDTDCNKIIGHIGWKGKEEYSKMVFDEVFGDFDGFVYLEVSPELEFTHPNERFEAGRYFSACDLSSHCHADEGHRAKISYGDPEYHALQCICGDVEYEAHSHDEMLPYDEEYHALKCACGDTEYEMHEYGEPNPFDEQYHVLNCACGDAKYEMHTLTSTPNGCFSHISECPCGYVEEEAHHFRLGGMMQYVCSGCGYTMPAGQMPTL
ncbi:MAG: hypothetical protein J5627_04315 [Bacilli bacterium]|nr:hypothetical protein [Bacilli bacterium]